ncbi:MAG: hypothetical protein WC700_07615 [Gemmatimonadaceae bacterium]|jgi:hypothetical protein
MRRIPRDGGSRLAAASPVVNSKVNYALVLAAGEGRPNLMRLARACGADDVRAALLAATAAGQKEAAALCFEWGAGNVNEALHLAVDSGNTELAELAWANGIRLFGETWGGRIINDVMVRALINGQTAAAEWCLGHGATPQDLEAMVEVIEAYGGPRKV